MERVFVALDVETTGLEAGVDEIIEIGAVKFRGDEVLETFQSMVKPRHSLPLKIMRLTGIGEADVANAPRFNDVAPELAKFVKSYPIVGHSIGFDLRMLQAQGMRFPQTSFDTFDLATLLVPQLPAYKLGVLAAALGIPHPDAHRATADADVSRQVFVKLLARINALRLQELQDINRLTAKMNWSLRELFVDAEKQKTKNIFVEGAEASPTQARKNQPIPLKPTDEPNLIDMQRVRHFFAPDGVMGTAFAGYEQRDQQVEMAEAVAEALNNNEVLLVEAGTGVGKSVAYLVPSIMHAVQRGERVVVSTNTINLQDQLYFKDLPDLQRLFRLEQGSSEGDSPFVAAMLKGRGNYLCLRRYKELRRDQRLSDEEIRALLKVQLWIPSTQSGDRAEIMLMDKEQTAWGRMNVTPDTCTGPRCPDYHDCFFFKARREAEAAHVVVVNHALMLADLAIEANVLPPYDHLIIDEAHNLEDVATDQLGFEIDQAGLLQLLDDMFQEGGANVTGGLLAELPKYFQGSAAGQSDMEKATELVRELGPIISRSRVSVYDLFNRLAHFISGDNDTNTYDSRLRLTATVRSKEPWQGVMLAWNNLGNQLTELGNGLGKLETLITSLKDAELLEYDLLLLRIQSLKRVCTDVRVNIGYVVLGDNAELVTWLSQDRMRDTLTMHAAPLSVAERLRADLFEQKATVVLASATLSINHNFEYVKTRIGVDEAVETQLESPFDYTRQALVYLPNDIPEPNHNGYQRMLETTLIELCSATEGRTLVLFTANNALRQTYKGIQEALEERGIAVLGQGIDGSRRSLIDRFKEFPGTVLLGTTSFWEGVDVVGDALSVLVIAKLPFSVPTDPVFAARCEGFTDSFNEFSVPQSILRFKQGFGRLIRSRSDRGVVAVLDKRLLSKKYGQTFLESLPSTAVRTGAVKQLPQLAARFLKRD